jgi:hydrogenase nickel incorporation protein HypA/HybF
MHEVSIMESTLEIALKNATSQGATKINHFKMRIGELSSIVPEALHFAFDVVTQNTIAQGATLEIETVPVKCYCSNCDLKFTPKNWFYECPQCEKLVSEILQGKEIELTSLEIDC